MKTRHFEIVIPLAELKVDIESVFTKYKAIEKFAFIVHDKDGLSSHLHIYLRLIPSMQDIRILSKWFSVPQKNIVVLNGLVGRLMNYWLYASNPFSARPLYQLSDITANFNVQKEIERAEGF